MEPGEGEGKEDPMMSDGDMDSTEQFAEDGAMEGDDGAMEGDGAMESDGAMEAGGDDMQPTEGGEEDGDEDGGDLGALEDGSGDGFVDVGEEGGDGSIGTIVQGSIIEGTTFGGDSDGNPGTTEKQTKCKRAFHVFHFEI